MRPARSELRGRREHPNLDEYRGLDGDHPQSYRYFMNQNLFDHIDIDQGQTRTRPGRGTAADAMQAECDAV